VAELVEGPIEVERLLAAAARPDCGAVVLFLGTTRNHHEGREVLRLEYEAYRPMALAALEQTERGTVERHAVASCRIVHRLGVVPAAEASVAVVVAAAHRSAAFDACRWAMDQVKSTAPIWKKEHYAGGDAAWVAGAKLE
jgi:molybdopterin synthase catalytic subunit